MKEICQSFYRRLVAALLFLIEMGWDYEMPCEESRIVFYKVRRKDGTAVTGDIIEMKEDIGFDLDIFGVSDRPYEQGTAGISVSGVDADGNDISDQVNFEVVSDDGKNFQGRVRQLAEEDGGTEGTFTIRIDADGDPDADEEAPIFGTLVVVADAKNATEFTITASPHVEASGGGSEPAPAPPTDEEPPV